MVNVYVKMFGIVYIRCEYYLVWERKIMKEIFTNEKRLYPGDRYQIRFQYYGVYTAAFLIFAIISYWPFISLNKALIWNGDGLGQHYIALTYYGKYLRGIVKELFMNGNLTFPLWDFSIGYGGDILTTFNYYVIGDPLNLLSALVPASKTEYLYSFLVLFRLYLAGISFSMYCRYTKKGRFATLCGSLTYVFCAYALFASARHPFFINPMIYFPLLLIGIEKVFHGKKPYLFIGTIFVSAISNFYFFYMLTILCFIYAIIRFFAVHQKNRVLKFFLCLRNFCGYYLVGVFLAGVLFIPSALALVSGDRISLKNSIDLFYKSFYYQKLSTSFITGDLVGSWTIIGCSAIILPAIVLLFMKKKQYKGLKISFVILTLMLLLPFAGHVMNGFSYSSNRWEWGYAFLLSFILVTMLPDLMKMTKKQLGIVLSLTFVYLVSYYTFKKNPDGKFLSAWYILLASVIVLGICSIIKKYLQISDQLIKKFSYIIVFGVMAAGIFFQATSRYGKSAGYIYDFVDRGTAYNRMMSTSATAVSRVEDEEFGRYETYGKAQYSMPHNSSVLNNVNGLSFYFSLSNNYISKFFDETANRIYLSFCYKGLDNRIALSTLANVKYQVAPQNLQENLFYGYKPYIDKKIDLPVQIYENQQALPFGYTYSNYLSSEVYKDLSPIEKQEAMLQAAVIDEKVDTMPEAKPSFSSTEIPYKIKYGKGIELENGFIHVKKGSATITLTLNGIKDAETYVVFKDLAFKAKKDSGPQARKAQIEVSSGDVKKNFKAITPQSHLYEGKKDYAVNLCYSDKPVTKIKIKLTGRGKYSFKDMKVICQPMDKYPAQVEALKADHLENTEFTANKISGSIDLDSSKLLCLTIPYSKGWTAYVDGKETQILRTNTMYSGILLDKGNHIVQLKYFTPGLKTGLLCTLIGVISLIAIALFRRRKKQ